MGRRKPGSWDLAWRAHGRPRPRAPMACGGRLALRRNAELPGFSRWVQPVGGQRELHNFDMVGLSGTQHKRGEHSIEKRMVDGRLMIQAGWGGGWGTNRSCGCGVLFGRRVKEHNIVGQWAMEGPFQGRGIAVHVKSGYFDWLPIVVYYPPRPTKRAQWPQYFARVSHVTKFVSEVLCRAPSSTTPIIFCDLSDGMGIAKGEFGGWEQVGTSCITEEASRKENLVGGAGEQLRRLPEIHGMVATSASLDPRDTWWGVDRSSLIDHVCIPAALLEVARGGGPLARAGRRLQVIKTARPADHLPVHAIFEYIFEHPTEEEVATTTAVRRRWDYDALMRGVAKGWRRKEFLEELEEVVKSKGEELQDMANMNTPDDYFGMMDEIVCTVAEKWYGKPREAEGGYKELHDQRMRLLDNRRSMREGLSAAVGEEELAACVERLKEVTYEMRRMRRRQYMEDKKAIHAEMWEAWQCRRLAEVQRLPGRLCRSRYGPKKRYYRTLIGATPTQAEWMEVWGLPGCQGGMMCEQVSWEGMLSEHKECAEPLPTMDVGYKFQAQDDFKRLANYLQGASKRKTCPSQSIPGEVLLMLLRPAWRVDYGRAGVGLEKEKLSAPATRQAMKDGYTMINRTGYTPLRWHRSRAGVLRKSARVGPLGKRVAHVLDTQGKAFFAMKVRKRSLAPMSDNDRGFLKHRRREGALLVQQSSMWRARRLGPSAVLNNADMSNAFGSTDWQCLDKAVEEDLLLAEDVAFGQQRYKWACVEMPCADGGGSLVMRIACGSLMGDPFAVDGFGRVFKHPIEKWNGDHKGMMGEDAGAFCGMSPVEAEGELKEVDLPLSKYADDIVKLIVNQAGKRLGELARRSALSNSMLDECLQPFGYKQNMGKMVAVLSAVGEGSRADKGKVRRGRSRCQAGPLRARGALGA